MSSGEFIVYHGSTSRPTLKQLTENYDVKQGVNWTTDKLTPCMLRWMFDNGAYSAYVNDESWSSDDWLTQIDKAVNYIEQDMMPRPDFAVLPDVVTEPMETYRRAERYYDDIPSDWSYYFALQDGMDAEKAVRFAYDLYCNGVFIGGTDKFKRDIAKDCIELTNQYDMKCHIARPGVPKGVLWARRIGADSVDSTTMVRNQNYTALRLLECQSELGKVASK